MSPKYFHFNNFKEILKRSIKNIMTEKNMWKEELEIIKSIIEKSGLTQTTKWGTDVYTHNGKNIISFAGFKNYFSLWFYNGVFLEDKHKKLINAQEGTTKALRQWRFLTKSEIDEKLILEYIYEAVENENRGKTWKAEKSTEIIIPEILKIAFIKDKNLETAFNNLTFYKQKDYVDYINSAKRSETKLARLEKISPMIINGIGLNDKYKNK